MNNNSPKHIALKTLIRHKCYSLGEYTALQSIVEFNQFTIIEYQKHTNTEPVSELIKRLGIEKEIEQNDSFLYINSNLKLIFINGTVPDQDKCALLRHELGHICDPDLRKSDGEYSKIKKEEFANDFSSYTKNPGILFRLCVFFSKNWKWLVCGIVATSCVLGFAFLMDTYIHPPAKPVTAQVSPYGESGSTYYVTSAGKKYHQKHCIIIRYKNNLTEIELNDALNKGYKPCRVCNAAK